MVGNSSNSKPLCGTDTALKASQPLIHHILTTTLGEASSVISILLRVGRRHAQSELQRGKLGVDWAARLVHSAS